MSNSRSGYHFAIIGCGKIATRHAENITRIGKLISVCDIENDKAIQLATNYNCAAFFSIDELLTSEKEIDIVVICTPNGLHAAHSIKALQANKIVLCEKPLCLSKKEGIQLQQAEANSSGKLFVVKSTRYNPAIIQLKEILDKKQLGKIYSFQLNCFWNRPDSYYESNWKGTLHLDGGVLFTQFSHYIDVLLWLFGDVEKINGFRKNLVHNKSIEFEDCGIVSVQMKNGILGGINWSINSFLKNMEVSLTVLAEKGTLKIGGEFMNEIKYQLLDGFAMKNLEKGNPNDYGTYKGSMSNHDKVYENLIRTLQDQTIPFATIEDGLKTVDFIETIYNSIPIS